MPINPAIALGVKGLELPDPLAQYSRVAAIQQAQQQNALAQYQLASAQRESEIKNRLLGLDPNAPDYIAQVKRVNPALGSELELRATQQERERRMGDQARAEAYHKNVQAFQSQARDASLNPTDAIVVGLGRKAVTLGIDDMNSAHQKTQYLLSLPMEKRTEFLQQTGSAPPPWERSNSSSLLSPEKEQQLIRIAQASRPPAQPREPAARTMKVDLQDGGIGVMNLDTGEIMPATIGGKPAQGKPSAVAEKTALQRQQLSKDLDTAIFELKNITKEGGLIDQSTGSGAGRAADVAAGFFGKATPGAIATAKLAPIADLALKMVPRFEGPQSDKDTASYKQAAGQLADPSLPSTIRKEAGKTVLRLMENRKGQFVTQGMAAEGTGAGGGVDANNPLLK